jgi:hypothetical protein
VDSEAPKRMGRPKGISIQTAGDAGMTSEVIRNRLNNVNVAPHLIRRMHTGAPAAGADSGSMARGALGRIRIRTALVG